MKKKIIFGVFYWIMAGLFYAPLEFMQLSLQAKTMIFMIILLILSFVLAVVYFKKTPGDFKQGFILGFIWIAVAAVGDTISFVYLITTENYGLIGQFSAMFTPAYIASMLITFVAIMLLTGFAGHSVHGGALVKKS